MSNYCVVLHVVSLYLLVYRKTPLNRCLAMGEEQKFPGERPEFRVGLMEEPMQENVQSCTHRLEGGK